MSGNPIKAIIERLKEFRRPGYYKNYDHKWTMVIDLDRCNGCEACVTACYAENNLPVVGKEDCGNSRVMNWIRVERYVAGEYPDVKVKFIPILCQQCSKAPCELGCPVYATYHNQDGLNVQVYNRCVGTFTCATYCPYDVRRFNWFTYKWDAPLEQQLNPDVTVREMGVMEKCTFCIQRIRAGKDKAKDEGRAVKDGDITPACAQSCPAGAFTFGDLNDPESRVSMLAKSRRRFRLFEELNTEPSVIYLKKVFADGGGNPPVGGHTLAGGHPPVKEGHGG
ncbi:MAG: 4Fe-4S dicluster domain-containing protein [Deltaproteobacteria bacterium]|nr:4Fe-4S dicluster domain-containing protein [Deltaproteobacteria bacterium]